MFNPMRKASALVTLAALLSLSAIELHSQIPEECIELSGTISPGTTTQVSIEQPTWLSLETSVTISTGSSSVVLMARPWRCPVGRRFLDRVDRPGRSIEQRCLGHAVANRPKGPVGLPCRRGADQLSTR